MTDYEVKAFLKFYDKAKKDHPDCCIELVSRPRIRPLDDLIDVSYVREYYDSIVNMNDELCVDDISAPDFFGYPLVRNENGKLEVSAKGRLVKTRKALSMNIVPIGDIKL